MFANNPEVSDCFVNTLYTSLTNLNLIFKWFHLKDVVLLSWATLIYI